MKTANEILQERRPLKESEEVDTLIAAIEKAAQGDYDSEATYTAAGKSIRIVSASGPKVSGYHLVLVTDQSSNPLGAPFDASPLARDPSGKWRAAVATVMALAKYGKKV